MIPVEGKACVMTSKQRCCVRVREKVSHPQYPTRGLIGIISKDGPRRIGIATPLSLQCKGGTFRPSHTSY